MKPNEILNKLVDKVFGLHSLQEKEVTKTLQALHAATIAALPNKRIKPDDMHIHGQDVGYDQAIDDVKKALDELYGLS
jgi:hypothetical protein